MNMTPDDVVFAALAKLMNTIPARQNATAVQDALTAAGYVITGAEAYPSATGLKLIAGTMTAAAPNEVEIIAAQLGKPAEIADAVATYDALSDVAAWLEYQGEDSAADDLRGCYMPLENDVNEGRRALELVAAVTKPGPDVMQALTTSLAEMVGPSRAGHLLDTLAPALAGAGLIIIRQPKEA